MLENNKKRASDTDALLYLKQADFVNRNRDGYIKKLLRFSFASIIAFIGVFLIVYNDTLPLAILCVFVGSVGLVLGKHIEKQKNVIRTTEFINALFSSIIAVDYDFTMIVNTQGTMVYGNRGVRDLFPVFMEAPTRTIDDLFAQQNLAAEERARMTQSIADLKNDETTLAFTHAEHGSRTIKITAEPIARPTGFVLIRGRMI